jgi:hypothetical protein
MQMRRRGGGPRLLDPKSSPARENVERRGSLRTLCSARLWLAASGRFFLILAAMVVMESKSKIFGA